MWRNAGHRKMIRHITIEEQLLRRARGADFIRQKGLRTETADIEYGVRKQHS
ncbi:MAG: hypothetical protein Q4G54_04725 [Pelistega sp.]|nr:hypothetical protein [Pelistega sp.]